MPVTKSVRECYEVREDKRCGEWANITLKCWDNPPKADSTRGMYYCGEITIHSSYGSWAYTWTACANPFKQFLCGIDFGYAFGKFMGTALDVFDGAATLKQIRRDILQERRQGSLDREEAREVWDLVKDEDDRIEHGGPSDYGYAMWDIGGRLDRGHPMRDYFNDPSGWPRCTHDDYSAAGFWRTLWPLFIAELRRETEPAACAA